MPISPSQINTYLSCRLQFFFKYVARLEAPEELSEEIDASQFGKLVHKLMELLYQDVKKQQGNALITEASIKLMQQNIPALLEAAYEEVIGLKDGKNKRQVSGLEQVIKEVAKQYANGFLQHDLAYVPFEVQELEEKFEQSFAINAGSRKVLLKGIVDRIDKKADTYRMVDYKTGTDSTLFESVPELFERESKKANKAALQTLIYCWMFRDKFKDRPSFQPALIPLRAFQIGSSDSRLYSKAGKIFVEGHNIQEFLLEIEAHLRSLVEEIFDPSIPFNQTEDLRTCGYCDFAGICNR